MCNCLKKGGGSGCVSKRGTLRTFRRELVTLYNNTNGSQLKDFLKGEIDTLKTLLRDMSFCPTKEFINGYKTETNATISELT